MPYITTRRVPDVVHIGHLESERSARRSTVDGPCIAVSTCPEDWRKIKGLNGPEYALNFSPAEWVDVLSFEKSDHDDLVTWMLARNYMRAAVVWNVTYYDEEEDDFIDFSSLDRAEAAAKVGRSLSEEIAAAERGEGAVQDDEGYVLQKRAMARLGGVAHWPDPLRWFDAAALLYTREVVLPKRPFIVGVWWDHPRNPDDGLADYGVLFPERAHLFSVEDEEGEVHEFTDAFPNCPGIKGRAA